MLTPEYLQGLPSELEKLYLKLEDDLISDICRRIKLAGRLTDTAEYQVLRMKELGAGTEYIKRKIAEYSQLSDDAVDRMFFDAAQVSDDFYREAYSKANKDYVPFEYNDFFQQIVTANINQTNGELRNFTRSMGFSYRGSNGVRRFHDTAETYRDCLDYAFTQVETGAADYITAVRNAARRLTESGLQFVDYSSGVVNHADVAVRRAVLTGISQVTGKIAEHNAAELDTDIVEVTAHAGARPDHAEWQGGWYSLSGKSKKYRSLAEATGYGRVDGLKGANCRHDFYPVIEGIDKPMYIAEELANIDPPPFTDKNGKTYTYYEATQRQRTMERAIRKTKREILAADSSGDSDMFTAKSVLLRRQREEYNRFSKAAGLLTQNERNQVVGFGRSVASRAAWADRKATASNSSGGSGNSNGSGGHAVEVSIPASAGSDKVYTGEKIVKPLDNSGGNGIIKETTKIPAKTLSLSNLNEFEEWQSKYYNYNSGVSFSREDNPNIFTYTGGAYDAINALERGEEQLEKAKRCYGNRLSEYEGIGNKISEELSKFKLSEPINVRRAVGNVDYITGASSSIEDMKKTIGKIFAEKGFTSTTVCSDATLPFGGLKDTKTVLDIYVPISSRGAYIYKISESPAEFEYLLDKNTKFKITDAGEREVVDKYTGKTTIERFMKLEVIPDD